METESPIASVIIPTYGAAPLLRRAINSVLSQTQKKLELLIILDGYDKEKHNALLSIGDSRLKILWLEKNSGGPAAPTNLGIANAKSPFIGFLDHDDWVKPDWIETLYQKIGGNEKLGMAWGAFEVYDKNGKLKSVSFRNPFGNSAPKKMPTLLNWTPGFSGLFVRKQVFDEIGNIDTASGALADFEFSFRFALKSKFEVSRVDKGLACYQLHDANLSRDIKVERAKEYIYLVEKYRENLKNYPEQLSALNYKIAWFYQKLGRRDESLEYISKSINTNPGNKKFRIFQYLVKFRIWEFVQPLINFRSRLGEIRRLIKYRRTF